MRDYDEPSGAKVIFGLSVAWFWALVVVVGSSIAVLCYYEPWRQNKETETLHQSNQYVTTKQQEMLSKLSAYNDMAIKIAENRKNPDNAEVVTQMESQQKRLYKDIKSASQQIDQKFVPRDVQTFLDEHKPTVRDNQPDL